MRYIVMAALASATTLVSTAAAADTLSFGPQTGTYSPAPRGYYFTAPSAFTITSLFIPTDASTGTQTVEVLRLNNTPPTTLNYTSDFSVLGFYSAQDASTPIATSIAVGAGDVIGILGYRTGTSSYIAGNQTLNLAGQSVVFRPLGSNTYDSTGKATEVFTEPGSSIGRINFNYTTAATGALPEPASWATMILGLGAVGYALRRRQAIRTRVAFTA